MTIRDDLVAQVQQALKDVPLIGHPSIAVPDYTTMANAAVDEVAIFVYMQLASEKMAKP